ncbi:COG4541 Predicted membrane protein [Rhabdaerophilaceae bacterium]
MDSTDFAILLFAMAIASYGCRIAGFVAMRYVPITPRIEAALRATPMAVMSGIVVVAALRGGPAEWISGCVVIVLSVITRNDVISAFAGIAAIALLRSLGL